MYIRDPLVFFQVDNISALIVDKESEIKSLEKLADHFRKEIKKANTSTNAFIESLEAGIGGIM